jgi:hypothetical protein
VAGARFERHGRPFRLARRAAPAWNTGGSRLTPSKRSGDAGAAIREAAANTGQMLVETIYLGRDR